MPNFVWCVTLDKIICILKHKKIIIITINQELKLRFKVFCKAKRFWVEPYIVVAFIGNRHNTNGRAMAGSILTLIINFRLIIDFLLAIYIT